MADIHDFIKVLNDIVDERFPNTGRYIIYGGDFTKDAVIELREDDKAFRYSPYELFHKSKNWENTIEQVVTHWEKTLHDS